MLSRSSYRILVTIYFYGLIKNIIWRASQPELLRCWIVVARMKCGVYFFSTPAFLQISGKKFWNVRLGSDLEVNPISFSGLARAALSYWLKSDVASEGSLF